MTFKVFERDPVAIVPEHTDVHEPNPTADTHQSKERHGNVRTDQLALTRTVGHLRDELSFDEFYFCDETFSLDMDWPPISVVQSSRTSRNPMALCDASRAH